MRIGTTHLTFVKTDFCFINKGTKKGSLHFLLLPLHPKSNKKLGNEQNDTDDNR